MTQQDTPNYPFSAIVGHEKLKMALLLTMVDPKIGGVLISGPRGTAKTTAARALAALLPRDGGRFLTLPLGATEDRLLGSINLERILEDGKVDFSPGLLHAVHRGILYVDEINLLPDHLVDLLLDVAVSGVNIVERESVSHQHPAQFVLIGTMNPDEGELRPQLVDRFGFFVALPSTCPAQQKVEIIKRRIGFEENRAEFVNLYKNHEQALTARCLMAKKQLATVQFNEDLYYYICDLTADAAVEGLRADLVIMRAARAYAAWQKKDSVDKDDIDYVAPFALAHRQKSESGKKPTKPEIHDPTNSAEPESSQTWGEMPPQAVATGPFRRIPANDKKKTL